MCTSTRYLRPSECPTRHSPARRSGTWSCRDRTCRVDRYLRTVVHGLECGSFSERAGVSKTDFDFLVGTWSVQHRRLTDPLDPDCQTWIDFTTVADAHHILDGLGNADQTSGTLPDGTAFHGYSLRLFAPEADEWSIWWASAGRPGVLDDPVRGSFENGIGTFVGPAEHGDRRFLARFRWLDTDTPQPLWVQDFSFDNGGTWAPINWRMTHTRL
jgi:hypothetical protein